MNLLSQNITDNLTMALCFNVKVDDILPAEDLIKMVESLEENYPGMIGYFMRLSPDVK
jgi:hypothetical protein